MAAQPTWSTACPDWEERILAGRSLVPFDPLFPPQAEAALAIFKSLRIVDAPGSPTMGEACKPWVFDLVAALFGAYDAETGRRLIRYFMLLVSKKNSKSTIAAGIMVTALILNWRESGEFTILAPTIEVANNSYKPASDMVMADPELRALLHPMPTTRTLQHRNTGATLKIVAADNDTVSGKKTIGLLVDELWLFGKRANAENMLREAMGGLASRPEGFVLYCSTQSDAPPAGVFAQKLGEFRDIRDGKLADPRSLPILYEFPQRLLKAEAYKDPKLFHVTNPNLGASVDAEFLADELVKAERAGKASLAGFLAKHLNVQIGQALRADGWAGAEIWARGVEPGLTLDEILARSEVVTVGIDGGGLDDLLGIGVIGRERGTKRWLAWAHAYISPEGLKRRKANQAHYAEFEAAGDLTVCELPGDIAAVVALVQRILDVGLLGKVGVDAIGIGGIVDALDEIGVTEEEGLLGGVRQGIALMGAVKTVERKIADGSFKHGGQPLMVWCVGNAVTVATPTAQRIARDESGLGKIDPLMALFDAAALMVLNPEAVGRSVFDELAEIDAARSGVADPRPADDDLRRILADPRHPRFHEALDRYNRQLALADDDAEF